MRAPLSVLIPTLDAAPALPACLAALVEGLEAGMIREVIVSDGGSVDATRAIADAAGAQVVTGPASRGGQLRRGAEAAQGAWLLVLHADTVLPEGWTRAARTQMNAGGPAAFRLSFDAAGVDAGAGGGLGQSAQPGVRPALRRSGAADPARRYEAAGGYPDIPLMEDVALARSLRGRIALMPLAVTTGADRYARAGWLRRGARNLWTLARYLCGADPARLAARYRR